jgi:hypothetical protein
MSSNNRKTTFNLSYTWKLGLGYSACQIMTTDSTSFTTYEDVIAYIKAYIRVDLTETLWINEYNEDGDEVAMHVIKREEVVI